jgi:hypothetical protein
MNSTAMPKQALQLALRECHMPYTLRVAEIDVIRQY